MFSQVYEFPSNRFAANFIGSTNMFEGTLIENEKDHALIKILDNGCDHCMLFVDHAVESQIGEDIWVAVRPEKVDISKTPPDNYNSECPINCIQGTVSQIAYLGGLSTYHITLTQGRKILKATDFNIERKADNPTWEDKVYLTWEPNSIMVLTS